MTYIYEGVVVVDSLLLVVVVEGVRACCDVDSNKLRVWGRPYGQDPLHITSLCVRVFTYVFECVFLSVCMRGSSSVERDPHLAVSHGGWARNHFTRVCTQFQS